MDADAIGYLYANKQKKSVSDIVLKSNLKWFKNIWKSMKILVQKNTGEKSLKLGVKQTFLSYYNKSGCIKEK